MPAVPFHLILAALILAGCTSPLPPSADPSSGEGKVTPAPTFYGAGAGDSVVIDFESSGCFHHDYHHVVVSHGSAPGVMIARETGTRYRWRGSDPPNKAPVALRSAGSTILTPRDIERLNKLIAFYRSNRAEGCTTVDQIQITRKHGSQILAHEEFEDASCRTHYDYKEPLTIPELVTRMEQGL